MESPDQQSCKLSGSCRLSRNDTGSCIMKQAEAVSFRKLLFTFNCVYVCGYVHVSTSVPGDEKGVWESLELELQMAVGCLK